MVADADEISVFRLTRPMLGPCLASLITRLHSTPAEGCWYIPWRINGPTEANFRHHRIKGLWWPHHLKIYVHTRGNKFGTRPT